MTEKEKYLIAKQNLADVKKGGKDHINCSFMDISIRTDKFNEAKNNFIKYLGKKQLKKLGV